MSNSEKDNSGKPEARPTDDESSSPATAKRKIVEPVTSRASHFS